MSKKFEHDWVCSFKSDPTYMTRNGVARPSEVNFRCDDLATDVACSRLTCVCLYKSSHITPIPPLIVSIRRLIYKQPSSCHSDRKFTQSGPHKTGFNFSRRVESGAPVLLFAPEQSFSSFIYSSGFLAVEK